LEQYARPGVFKRAIIEGMTIVTSKARAVELGGPSAESASDHELVAAIREGDEAAFDEIVRRYQNQITNFMYRMIDDYDRSVELAQETFIRIYTSAHRYKADYSFSTYIYRIAANLAISEIRRRRRRKLLPLNFSDEDGEQVHIDLPDGKPLPDELLIEEERRRAVARAIKSLPEKYRAAVVLRDIEGLSYEQIARALNLSEGTVKSRINRARNLLREKLSAYI
jgi:RNA polymerase sigma-70 factor (ECF subfamily)